MTCDPDNLQRFFVCIHITCQPFVNPIMLHPNATVSEQPSNKAAADTRPAKYRSNEELLKGEESGEKGERAGRRTER